jgi:hypothetical protein
LTLAVLFFGHALAAPLESKNAEAVRVAVNRQPRLGLGVKPSAGSEGWRLQLKDPKDGTAQVVDVTPGTAARTLKLSMNAGELVFDTVRFVGGHVYHVQLHHGADTTSSGFVYLYPSAAPKPAPQKAMPQHLKFETDATTDRRPEESDGIQITSKSGL